MNFPRDNYGNLIQSRLFLANPQKNYIGEIGNAKEIKFSDIFNNMNEFTFKIYEFENGEYTDFFEEIENKRLIELQYLGWYQIVEVKIPQEEDSIYRKKIVKCLSLENELVDKRLDYINGVYSLYDILDIEFSLLHLISKLTTWKIGHVDNELIGKKRTFDIDSTKIYNFLTTDVSKSFQCVFKFDTYSKTINAYKLSNYGHLTNIVVSGENILNSYEQVSKGEEIVTKMRVQGASGVDIRDVNPTASNDLININYYLNTKWMSQGLIDAYKNYQNEYNSVLTTYNNNRTLLKNQLAELAVLKAQLTDLEGLKKAQEEIQGSYIQLYNGTPPRGTNEYTQYLNAVNAVNSYIAQISDKKVSIQSKQAQIDATKVILGSIGTNLNMSNYFSPLQLDELSLFLTEGETYQDDTFVITDNMTDEEIMDMKLELMRNGESELARASQPQFTTTITANNLFTLRDEADSFISYSEWIEQFDVGNLITIKFRDDYWTTARLIKMEIEFDNPSEIQLTFSNKDRFEDELVQLTDVIAEAGKSANAYSMSKYGYDQASSITSDVRDFMNGNLNATLNAIQNNNNQEMLLDTYGLHMRKWLDNQNKYDDCQSWWTNNVLLFTSDAWKSAKTGIGQFITTSGERIQAVFADVICGQLIMSENLFVTNSSGTYTVDKNGITATSGIYSVGINPSIPTDIINVKVDGIRQLYMDTVNKKLVYNGTFTSDAISTMNLVVGENVTMGENATINWTQVNDASTNVTNITKDTVTTSYINALGITAHSVRADWVYAGNISADKITAGTLTSMSIKNDEVYIDNNTIQFYTGGAIKRSGSKSWSSTNRFLDNVLSFGSQDIQIGQYSANAVNILNIPMREINIGYSNSPTYSTVNVYAGNGLFIYMSGSSYLKCEYTSVGSQTITPYSSWNIGSSSSPFNNGYFKQLYINGIEISSLDVTSVSSLYASSSYYITLNSSRQLVPNSSNTSYPFYLGSSSYPWQDIYVRNITHLSSTGKIGLYGVTPVSRQSISKITSTSAATSTSNATKINEIIVLLTNIGISSS